MDACVPGLWFSLILSLRQLQISWLLYGTCTNAYLKFISTKEEGIGSLLQGEHEERKKDGAYQQACIGAGLPSLQCSVEQCRNQINMREEMEKLRCGKDSSCACCKDISCPGTLTHAGKRLQVPTSLKCLGVKIWLKVKIWQGKVYLSDFTLLEHSLQARTCHMQPEHQAILVKHPYSSSKLTGQHQRL